MPQLNPLPWFTILAFSWAILLVLTPAKVFTHTKPNGLILLDINTNQYPGLIWQW
uniref:ATP synthase F0 subunit 8 n=1 Tax=Brevibora dorsiocellata TaxID=1142237 RepID=UPI002028838B|nr:ATP synthase F0 subunit 8 [Brevibora dorsiocellata]UQJ78780.1 ATP synthase F0 subunit 8 [Brevibora dorsiocellata]